jgi:hypothetical protein
MTETTASPATTSTRPLQLWMRLVGGWYLLVAAFNTPPMIEARFGMQYEHLNLAVESAPAQALVDVWFMFGLEIGVIGAALLYFSRDPRRHIALVWTVIFLEVVRGIVDDIYLIARGYDPIFYAAFIVVHLVVILTGLAALRRMRTGASS